MDAILILTLVLCDRQVLVPSQDLLMTSAAHSYSEERVREWSDRQTDRQTNVHVNIVSLHDALKVCSLS